MVYLTLPEISTVYFGITTQPISHRWCKHRSDALSATPKCVYLHRSMKKHGVENFQIQQMFESESLDECKKWEVLTIKSARQIGLKLWNLSDGGEGASGIKRSEETKKKMSDALRGKPKSEAHKRNLSIARLGISPSNKGVPMSEEQKRKVSAARKGIPAHNKGVPMSEEQKQKLRIINLGRKQSEETIQKRQGRPAKNKGMKRRTEYIQKLIDGVLVDCVKHSYYRPVVEQTL